MTSRTDRNPEEFVSQVESLLREFQAATLGFQRRAAALAEENGEPEHSEDMYEHRLPPSREAYALMALTALAEEGGLLTSGTAIPSQRELEEKWCEMTLRDLRGARLPQAPAGMN